MTVIVNEDRGILEFAGANQSPHIAAGIEPNGQSLPVTGESNVEHVLIPPPNPVALALENLSEAFLNICESPLHKVNQEYPRLKICAQMVAKNSLGFLRTRVINSSNG
jgi:hypothetical protein